MLIDNRIAIRFSVLVFTLSFCYIIAGLLSANRHYFILQGKEEKADETAIKDAVALYDKIMTDIYVTDGNPLRLNDLPAVTRLRHEIFADIGFLRSHDMRIMYDLANLEFTEVKRLNRFSAEATVFEEWNYQYKKLKTGEMISQPKGLGQGFKYVVVRKGDGWVIEEQIAVDIPRAEK
ncbi:MAG: hypothetical protein HY809_09255 [Nitrospirae bacterium]|nr:hypothetical protein [Nitrospirota bacterium]